MRLSIIKRNNHRYNSIQSKKKKFNAEINQHSRSSSLHSLVQATTFLSRPVWKINKMIATTTSPNSNQFANNNGKAFNTFKNNRRNEFCNNKMPNKNLHRQVSSGPMHQNKSNPIQIRNNFANQQYYNNQSGSLSSSFGFNAASSLANMIQNSELTVNLTNNEPRLVIFNNNISNNNSMPTFNTSLPNNNNYRESNKFFTSYFNNNNNNKIFHHPKQQQQQQPQQQQQTHRQQMPLSADNSSVLAFKHNNNQRYSNRFKYIKSASNCHSATKNSAPYNTTQYIMFDYSRRRPHDQECPNEQKSFTDEWNMALAANSNTKEADSTRINNTSIINDNYNDFSLNSTVDDSNEEQSLRVKRQFSLSEQNLEKMDHEAIDCNNDDYDEENLNEQMQQLSSSL